VEEEIAFNEAVYSYHAHVCLFAFSLQSLHGKWSRFSHRCRWGVSMLSSEMEEEIRTVSQW
jgi:hypothetical protein